MIFSYFAIDVMDIYGLRVCNRTTNKPILQKKNYYIIAIALIRSATCLKYKFLSEVCFGMIFHTLQLI
jgi:hypothetical protein